MSGGRDDFGRPWAYMKHDKVPFYDCNSFILYRYVRLTGFEVQMKYNQMMLIEGDFDAAGGSYLTVLSGSAEIRTHALYLLPCNIQQHIHAHSVYTLNICIHVLYIFYTHTETYTCNLLQLFKAQIILFIHKIFLMTYKNIII